ncbi:MAG: response regulator [Flavipsychrobacter sp.]
MYKVIIIEDEMLGRQLLRSLLENYAEFNVVAECEDGFEGFKKIQELSPDLIFLDIQMPKLNGFEMLELLENPPAVIFTTAFDEYALKGFEANAIDYLLKPITRSRFDDAIQKSLSKLNTNTGTNIETLTENKMFEGFQRRIVVKDKGQIKIIPSQDILYIEANDDYIKVVTANGSFLKKSTLMNIEKNFDPKLFVRVHRSYIIPISQLSKIEPYGKDSHIALLHCGEKITVSKSGMTKLKEVLGW